MKTKIYLENNAVHNHSEELAVLGCHAFIITGGNSAKKNGALDDVTSVLDSAGVKWDVFSGVEENPSVETVMKAAKAGIDYGVDFVIGIGGGSPLDAAKAISIMIKNKDRDWKFLYESGEFEALPVAAIPTTCGTGSEVTGVSVLTRHDKRTKISAKKKLFPDLALLDPKYLYSAPASLIRNTSIDAMGHMIESYVNANATSESREYVAQGLSIWSQVKDCICDLSKISEETYKNFLLAANYGGAAIIDPGTSMPHGLSYRLSYEYHVPHGMAIGIFEPAFLKLADESDRQYLLNLMKFNSIDEFSEFIRLNCVEPMLESYISRDELLTLVSDTVDDFLKDSSRVAKLPFEVTKEGILTALNF